MARGQCPKTVMHTGGRPDREFLWQVAEYMVIVVLWPTKDGSVIGGLMLSIRPGTTL